ncbi:MAG: hypothetical protein WC044_07455 [Crocinitomicaceae bacterium]
MAFSAESNYNKKDSYATVIAQYGSKVEKLNLKQTLKLAYSYYKTNNFFQSKILYYKVKNRRELADVHKLALADILLSTNMLDLSTDLLATCKDKTTPQYQNISKKISWTKANNSNLTNGTTEKLSFQQTPFNTCFAAYQNKVMSKIQLDRRNPISVENQTNFANMPELNYTVDLKTFASVESIQVRNSFVLTEDNTLFFASPQKNDGFNRNHNSSLSISCAKVENGAIVSFLSLPFCSPTSNYVSPFFSNNKLYFSSDKPGGYGGYDLYSATLISDGTWTEPVNLGNQVNSAGNEMYPTLVEGKLYFSSDSHPGFGGTDLFCSLPQGNNFGQPMNLGLGINSGYDDFSFIKTENNTYLFLSNRDNLKGYDEVFEVQNYIETAPIENLTVKL